MLSEDHVLSNDEETWLQFNYMVKNELRAFVILTYKAKDGHIAPRVEYFTPFVNEYNTSLTQISRVGKFIKQSKNEINGIDKLYSVQGMKFLYSTFPLKEASFELGEKRVLKYKISIYND